MEASPHPDDGAKPPTELEWVHTLKHGGAVPLKDFHHCSHGWASPPGNTFLVRGPHYLETKVKIPGGDWLLQQIGFDWIKSSSKISNIMQHPNCRVKAALKPHASYSPAEVNTNERNTPFVWAFNLQLSNKENHSIVMYYASFHNPQKGSLTQRFLDGDDAFRNSRLKLLASIPQGPWIVKAAVGERGAICLIGKKITCTYIREEDYMEVDVDVGSSMVARTVTQLAIGATSVLTVDIAFLLEGMTPLELPERILATNRFANLDLSKATSIDSNLVTDKPNPCNRLWRSLSKLLPPEQADPVANVEDEDEEKDDDSAPAAAAEEYHSVKNGEDDDAAHTQD